MDRRNFLLTSSAAALAPLPVAAAEPAQRFYHSILSLDPLEKRPDLRGHMAYDFDAQGWEVQEGDRLPIFVVEHPLEKLARFDEGSHILIVMYWPGVTVKPPPHVVLPDYAMFGVVQMEAASLFDDLKEGLPTV